MHYPVELHGILEVSTSKGTLDVKFGMLKSNFIIRNYCDGTGEDTLLISWKHILST